VAEIRKYFSLMAEEKNNESSLNKNATYFTNK
jgi:hypothetical protein